MIGVLVLTACSTVDLPEGRYDCTTAAECPKGWFCHVDRLCYSTAELAADVGYDATDGMAGSGADSGEAGTSGSGGGEPDAGVDSAVGVDAAPCVVTIFWTDVVTPLDEGCDGIDNDCDGTVDEGNPGALGCKEVRGLNTIPLCIAGICVDSAGGCHNGWEDCDGAEDNGCEHRTLGCFPNVASMGLTCSPPSSPSGARYFKDCDDCEYETDSSGNRIYTGRRVGPDPANGFSKYVDGTGCPTG